MPSRPIDTEYSSLASEITEAAKSMKGIDAFLSEKPEHSPTNLECMAARAKAWQEAQADAMLAELPLEGWSENELDDSAPEPESVEDMLITLDMSGLDLSSIDHTLTASDLEMPDDTPTRLETNKALLAKYRDRKRAKTADRTRERTAKRVREHRAKPQPIGKVRLAALMKATERASGDRFLEKIVGRERELVEFWIVMQGVRSRLGAKASLSKIADQFQSHTGRSIHRNAVDRLIKIIAKLERPSGVWD